MKTVISFVALVAMSGVALAGQPANVDKMTAAHKSGGGGNNSPLKGVLGVTGNGGVASFVSGGGTGGWGNVGSVAVGAGQISNSKK